MLATDNIEELERKAFLLFKSECTEDYKRLVIYLVYATVKQNPGISLNKLAFALSSEYNIDSDSVNSAVGALSSSEIFHAITSYTLPKEKSQTQPTLLRIARKAKSKGECSRPEFTSWINFLQSIGHAALNFKAIKV